MIEFNFLDPTIKQAKCSYNWVNLYMTKELANGNKKWMVQSRLMITSEYGFSELKINFYDTKMVEIIQYSPSSGGELNEDLQTLSGYVQEKGWDMPSVHRDLAKKEEKFWKRYWQTGIVQSEFLKIKYSNMGVN